MQKFAVTAGLLLTAASVALAVIFFAATQAPSGRDWICIAIGAVVAALVVGLIALGVFHGDSRVESRRNAQLVASRKAELFTALPTRQETIGQLRNVLTESRRAYEAQKSMVNSCRVEAIEAQQHHMLAFAAEQFGLAQGYEHMVKASEEAILEQTAELERIRGLSDLEYLAEVKTLRGLA